MSANNSGSDNVQDKSLSETNMQTVPQNLTTIQNIQNVQNVQNIQVPSNIQNIHSAQAGSSQNSIVGKSISLELNPKLLMKSTSIPSSIGTSSGDSKLSSSFCAVPGQTVRIITPNMLSLDRQGQPQIQQGTQQTSIPSTFHVPRGPAAVASISTPRATVATPLVRTITTAQPIPITRPGNPATFGRPNGPTPVSSASTQRVTCNRISVIDYTSSSGKIPRVSTTVSSTQPQWQQKTSVVYTQPQRHPVPVVNRPPSRPAATTIYTTQQQQPQQQQQQQQPRLVTPNQVNVSRSVQATVVTATPRLITPILQTQSGNNVTRLPTPPRPATPQVVTSLPQVSQAGRPVAQNIQPNQTSRSLGTTPMNRIAVSAPVIGASNRVATVTSVQTTVGRQLTINTVAGASAGTVSRIVIPQQIQQPQQQPQSQQQGSQRVVQTVQPLANFTQVSRVIATTSTAAVAGNVARISQTGPTSVARITSIPLHPVPLTPARAAPTPIKVTAQAPPGIQAVQLKQATTLQPQPQQQQQPPQQQQQGPTLQRQLTGMNNVTVTSTNVTGNQPAQVQGQYLHSQHTTFYSIEPSGSYPQYRQASMQPVRLLVEQGYEEPPGKPNASPRPSILRKRDHDGSPGKGIAKNLVPVLASLPASTSMSSPPGSPKDRDNCGHNSSGSTTVSATSSPGLDEEPEQSRIPIMNQAVEMSPRKKPRKQQLTGVEFSESRCPEEEMQFITEEKLKRDIKEDSKEKYGDRKQQDTKSPPPVTTKSKRALLSPGYKNHYSGRLHHYKRPSDVKPKTESKPTIHEIAQEKDIMQRIDGWKVYHLTQQMHDLANLEKSVYDKLKGTLTMLESQQHKDGQKEHLEKVNELIKGNMQRSNFISDGMNEARLQLESMFDHKSRVKELLQRVINKRPQKKRDK